MSNSSMPDGSDSFAANSKIEQSVGGDRNQTIGQVLGGMVVYGQVIYNNPPEAPDSSTAKPKATDIGPNPYKGLLAFQETDGDRFFGRDQQIKELWEKFRGLHEQESAIRVLTIYGPSGSGKSSLARAGLIPALANQPLPGHDRARVAVLIPGSHPLEALATVLARIATAGHPLDQATVSLLIEQTEGREGALPLLQFALTRIWAGLAEGKEPAETLEKIGGVGGALAGEAQRIYGSLTPEEQEIARRVFLGLVQLGEGVKDTRRRAELERVVSHRDNIEQVEKVIARFADPSARLITLSGDAGAETAEVTHEALFDNWQQMKDWLDSSRSDLRFQRRLDEAAMLWQGNGRPEGNLWRSPDLDLLRRFHERAGDDMTPLQVGFLNAAIASEIAQKEAAEKIEKDRQRQRRMLTGALSTGLVMVTGFAGFALYQLEQAQLERVIALAAMSQSQMATQPVEAEINAIVATGLSHSPFFQFLDRSAIWIAESFLDRAIRNPERNRISNDDVVWFVAFSPDGKTLASGSSDKVRLWDAKTGLPESIPLMRHDDAEVNSVAFSPDGKIIVSGGSDNTVRLWDAKTGSPVITLRGDEGEINSVAFSPDGRTIVSGGDTIRLWRTPRWDKFKIFKKQPLKANDDFAIRRITRTIEREAIVFPGHVEKVNSVAISPDGKTIVSGSQDKTIRIWEMPDGHPNPNNLDTACRQLQYHPVITEPTTDIAREAMRTCEPYWEQMRNRH